MLTSFRRALDEKAALQRQREDEAAAKMQAKKTTRVPDRTAGIRPEAPTRAESSERPAASSGPPRLALAGNKPTWRERQAAKEAEKAAGNAPPPAAPATDIATEEVQLPKKSTGYVPPARRTPADGAAPSRGRPDTSSIAARDTESSTEPRPKWRPGSTRDALGHDDSPADRAIPRFLDGLKGTSGARDVSPADGMRPVSSSGTNRTESPAEELRKPAPAKYVPVHMRNK